VLRLSQTRTAVTFPRRWSPVWRAGGTSQSPVYAAVKRTCPYSGTAAFGLRTDGKRPVTGRAKLPHDCMARPRKVHVAST
jgi:hypothetical protein